MTHNEAVAIARGGEGAIVATLLRLSEENDVWRDAERQRIDGRITAEEREDARISDLMDREQAAEERARREDESYAR